jgi:hypothetical protein
MFTLEESALLRRMLHAVMWMFVMLGMAGAFFLSRPWFPQLRLAARWLLGR